MNTATVLSAIVHPTILIVTAPATVTPIHRVSSVSQDTMLIKVEQQFATSVHMEATIGELKDALPRSHCML